MASSNLYIEEEEYRSSSRICKLHDAISLPVSHDQLQLVGDPSLKQTKGKYKTRSASDEK